MLQTLNIQQVASMATTTFSSLLSFKPEKFLIDSPAFANNYSSPPFVVVKIPMTTRRQRTVFTSCISNHTTRRDATKLRSSTSGIDIPSRLSPDEPRSGVLILVDALQSEGVTDVFTNKDHSTALKALLGTTISTHMLHTRCSELVAAMGYAMATGFPGVCMTSAISAGGLTYEFTHGVAYAYENNIPLVVIGDGWEEEKLSTTRTTKDYGHRLDEMVKCRLCITSAKHIPKIIRAALFLARSGRPGPVLIDRICHGSVHKLDTPVWDVWDQEELICPRPLLPPSTVSREPTRAQLEKVIGLLRESKRPLVCLGSGCFEWRKELTRFVELTGIPVFKADLTSDTPVYLTDGDFSFRRYREPYNQYSVQHFDLLLALDTCRSYNYGRILDKRHSDSIILQFDVTGDCEEEEVEVEVEHEKKLLDVQPGSVSSIRCDDMKSVLERLNHLLEEGNVDSCLDFSAWRKDIDEDRTWKAPPDFSDYVKDVLNDVANRGDTFIFNTTDLDYRVRFWDWFTRGSLVSQNYRHENCIIVDLPFVAGAAIGKGRRTSTCGDEEEITIIHILKGVDVFTEKIQEFAVVKRENLPVKVVIFNEILKISKINEMLKMNDVKLGTRDLVSMVQSLEIPYLKITEREEVRDAMTVMMETPGPYVLEIIAPCDPDSIFDEHDVELCEMHRDLFGIFSKKE